MRRRLFAHRIPAGLTLERGPICGLRLAEMYPRAFRGGCLVGPISFGCWGSYLMYSGPILFREAC